MVFVLNFTVPEARAEAPTLMACAPDGLQRFPTVRQRWLGIT
jgi:hypothetical protein